MADESYQPILRNDRPNTLGALFGRPEVESRIVEIEFVDAERREQPEHFALQRFVAGGFAKHDRCPFSCRVIGSEIEKRANHLPARACARVRAQLVGIS